MSYRGKIAVITGSPTRPSRTAGLASFVSQRLADQGFALQQIHLRSLPAEALLHARFDDPAIKEATAVIEGAHGVIVASPVYKAAYSGLLKTFLDLLPQFALRGKVVLPLLTGGTTAHVLALDYALRPVLQSLDPRLIVAGLFVLDKTITLSGDNVEIETELLPRLELVTRTFVEAFALPEPLQGKLEARSLNASV
jgi:FMN reductase